MLSLNVASLTNSRVVLRFLVVSRGLFRNSCITRVKLLSLLGFIKVMLKKMQPERICEECGRLIRNRRADARKCIDCRRRNQQESSRKVKAKEKKERIWNKVERSGIKSYIEKKI